MNFLLPMSRLVDAVNERIGRAVAWLVLLTVLVSAVNAVVRKLFNVSSNAFLELQWYLFSGLFLCAAGFTLLHNEHVRIDLLAGRFSRRTQCWIDIFCTLFFLLPLALMTIWLSWSVFTESFASGETSPNAGGLILWPARLLVPVGFSLLALQGLSEVIKRLAYLRGLISDPVEKHAFPMDSEMEPIEEIRARTQTPSSETTK